MTRRSLSFVSVLTSFFFLFLAVADVWAFGDVVGLGGVLVGDTMSMHHGHDTMGKLVPSVGDTLVSGRSTPMLTLVADTGPGVHDTTVAACRRARGSHSLSRA